MSPFFLLVFALGVALTLWFARKMRDFLNDYSYLGAFAGQRYDCMLRFAGSEYDTPCAVGADSSALYLFASSSYKRRWWARGRTRMLKQALRIPWTDLQWQESRILFKEVIRFEVTGRKIYFFIPKEIGTKVLADAGQQKTIKYPHQSLVEP